MTGRNLIPSTSFLFIFAMWLTFFAWNCTPKTQDKDATSQTTDMSAEDIAWRVRLGLHYMDNNPDPAQDWMPYAGGLITGSVSHYTHGGWDACDTGWRMVESYILARQVLGQLAPGDAEQKLRAFVLATLRKDGLSYRPDKPWSKPDATMWDHGRAVIALATWLEMEPSDPIAQAARNMAEGLATIAVREKEYWHFPADCWTGTEWLQREAQAFPPTGLAIEGLVDLAAQLKDKRYLDMAGYFVRAVLNRKPALFAEDGSMVRMGGGPYPYAFTHVHARLGILIGLLKYALATNDEPMRDWCIRAYRFVKENMCSSFGWVPEAMESGTDEGVSILSTYRRDEVCSISDMMQMARLLVHNGIPEERATIGRYGTNHLLAHQLVNHTPIQHLIVSDAKLADTPEKSYRGMPERALGSFTCGTYPNDLCVDLRSFGAPQFSIDAAGCCSPAGIKSLYVLWREATERTGSNMHIYLWVTLENEYLAMTCDEPMTGKLHVKIKQPFDNLFIHIPDYVDSQRISVNRGRIGPDHILHVGQVRATEVITVSYPLLERRTAETIAGKDYQIDWRGGRVVKVSPQAAGCDPYWWRAAAR